MLVFASTHSLPDARIWLFVPNETHWGKTHKVRLNSNDYIGTRDVKLLLETAKYLPCSYLSFAEASTAAAPHQSLSISWEQTKCNWTKRKRFALKVLPCNALWLHRLPGPHCLSDTEWVSVMTLGRYIWSPEGDQKAQRELSLSHTRFALMKTGSRLLSNASGN